MFISNAFLHSNTGQAIRQESSVIQAGGNDRKIHVSRKESLLVNNDYIVLGALTECGIPIGEIRINYMEIWIFTIFAKKPSAVDHNTEQIRSMVKIAYSSVSSKQFTCLPQETPLE